jgi:methionyl-tRNA formyltransferase
MFGPLSRVPLATLLKRGDDVRAVVVPGAPGDESVRELTPPADWTARPRNLAAIMGQTIVDLAWECGLPVLAVARFDAAAIDAIAAYTPDLLVVSCFPLRFPATLLALPPLGVLNLHPALLPRGRGADPLFWAFREPDPSRSGAGGVTVHLMDARLDAGPIVAQDQLVVPDGITEDELTLQLASRGAALLGEAIDALAARTAVPEPQDEARATTYPLPGVDDLVLRPEGSARWLFNCLRGLGGRRLPLTIAVGAARWRVRAALGYESDTVMPEAYLLDGATLRVRCAPGVVIATIWDDR